MMKRQTRVSFAQSMPDVAVALLGVLGYSEQANNDPNAKARYRSDKGAIAVVYFSGSVVFQGKDAIEHANIFEHWYRAQTEPPTLGL